MKRMLTIMNSVSILAPLSWKARSGLSLLALLLGLVCCWLGSRSKMDAMEAGPPASAKAKVFRATPQDHGATAPANRDTRLAPLAPGHFTDWQDVADLLDHDEIDWERLVRIYPSRVDGAPRGMRRRFAKRIGRLAGEDRTGIFLLRSLLEAFPEFYERSEFAAALAGSWPEARLGEAESVSRLFIEESAQRLFLHRVGKVRAEEDWIEAAEWAAGLNETRAAEAAWSGVIAGAAESDPEALHEWAMEHELPEAVTAASAKLARRLVATDPLAAAQFAASLPPSAARTQALNFSLSAWAAIDREAVIAWSAEAEDPALQSLAALAVSKTRSRPVDPLSSPDLQR